jgi:hypothetical protein
LSHGVENYVLLVVFVLGFVTLSFVEISKLGVFAFAFIIVVFFI